MVVNIFYGSMLIILCQELYNRVVINNYTQKELFCNFRINVTPLRHEIRIDHTSHRRIEAISTSD